MGVNRHHAVGSRIAALGFVEYSAASELTL